MCGVQGTEQCPAHHLVDVSYLQALAETRAGLDRDELRKVANVTPAGISILDPPDCRICLEVGDDGDSALVQPCSCLGSLSFVHLACLERWIAERSRLSCELCGQPYKDQVVLQLQQCTVQAAAAASEREKPPAQTQQRRDYTTVIKVVTWTSLAVLVGFVVIVATVARRSRSPDTADAPSHERGYD